jgi:hypothetical protein
MKTIKQLTETSAKLQEIIQSLSEMEYSQPAMDSGDVGTHLIAVESHLDNAIGRISTLIQTVRRVEYRAANSVSNPHAKLV